jgi:hypothetical protein
VPDPTLKAAKSGNVALAGRDGAALSELVGKAVERGGDALSRIISDAIRRAGPSLLYANLGPGFHLFTGEEYRRLTDLFEQAVSTGAILGHYRIRERMMKAQAAGGFHRFAEETEVPFAAVEAAGTDIPLLTATSALEYFRRLVPILGIDPKLWVPAMHRTAMTLAVATETSLIERIQGLVAGRLQSGDHFGTAPADIEELIRATGASPLGPQYAQMVFRTNTMDAYNVGQQVELEHPDVAGFFPAWKYLGIRDGRQGADHEPQFNRYYPNGVTFHRVRGPRPFNCVPGDTLVSGRSIAACRMA